MSMSMYSALQTELSPACSIDWLVVTNVRRLCAWCAHKHANVCNHAAYVCTHTRHWCAHVCVCTHATRLIRLIDARLMQIDWLIDQSINQYKFYQNHYYQVVCKSDVLFAWLMTWNEHADCTLTIAASTIILESNNITAIASPNQSAQVGVSRMIEARIACSIDWLIHWLNAHCSGNRSNWLTECYSPIVKFSFEINYSSSNWW